MASTAKDDRFLFLVAAVITVIAAGALVANVQNAEGSGVMIGDQTLDQITSVILQLMLVFTFVLFGYFIIRYFTGKSGGRIEWRLQPGEVHGMMPYAVLLLALWLVLFIANPSASDRPPVPDQGNITIPSNATSPSPVEGNGAMPLVFPMIVVLIAIVSIVIVWKIFRGKDGAVVGSSVQTKEEGAKATLEAAVRSLYAGEDPRSTIIRTYQQMCLLVQAGKLEEEPFLTPREFTDRAVDALGWKREPLEELTLLFEEARYSDHVLGEEEKQRAIASLERVKESLGGGNHGTTAH